MIRANINITTDTLFYMFQFELKDGLCLERLETITKARYPGNYRFVEFVDPTVTQGDSLFLITAEFDSEEDHMLFAMTWEPE